VDGAYSILREEVCRYKNLAGKPDHLEDLGIDRIIPYFLDSKTPRTVRRTFDLVIRFHEKCIVI
jgi:hypothetical protein